ncbi:hypothetical protein C5O00_03125 [Pukyongia salina]|uniref:Uncharacterized protein n=1 Tax=Pukyongia salina TaxID=2094025 RepID=A0A2S0HUJ3_9FLAO|nr:hypothetical protein [Pukyongia salina]AVI50214.1 hypothetical protein C5O00_03125 [Pukyongia salina]
MKTRYLTIALLMLITLVSCDKQERERKKKLKPIAQESVDSFTAAVNGIDWQTHNPPGPQHNEETGKPCFQSLMNMYGQLADLDIDERRFDEILRVFDFSRLIQKPVDEGNFGDIEGADVAFLAHPVRDRILIKIDAGYTADEFVDEVKGNGDLSAAEEDALKNLYDKFLEEIKKGYHILNARSTELGQCTFSEHLAVRFKSVNTGAKQLLFSVHRQVIFVCKCGEDNGPNDPRFGYISWESILTANYENNGLYNLAFTGTTAPELKGAHIVCCRNNNQEEGSGGSEEDENH